MLKHLKNKKGDLYISCIVETLIILFLLAFIISIIPMFAYKIKQNDFCDKLCRQLELTGQTDDEFWNKYNTLSSDENMNPDVDLDGTDFTQGNKVNLGKNISVTLKSTYHYSFAGFVSFDFTVKSHTNGTSEQYWKG